MKRAVSVVIAASILAAACGSKTDANEKNFSAAMSQYFEKKGALCTRAEKWPVDLSAMELKMHERKALFKVTRMEALAAAGLAKVEDLEVDVMNMAGKPSGRKAQVRRYVLTDTAKPFARERTGGLISGYTELCWGQMALDTIVKWEGPMKFGDYQEAGIVYTYKVANAADWVTKPEILETFNEVKEVLDGVEKAERKHVVKLTSIGWEAKGLDN